VHTVSAVMRRNVCLLRRWKFVHPPTHFAPGAF